MLSGRQIIDCGRQNYQVLAHFDGAGYGNWISILELESIYDFLSDCDLAVKVCRFLTDTIAMFSSC